MRTALATLALAGALSAPALAGTGRSGRQPLLDSTVGFLQESQRASGGFAVVGRKPSQGISAWVALALAAASVNPRDQARCGVDAYAYLEGHFHEALREELAWPEIATTAFERELLVTDAAGADPHSFAGTDLVAEILARQLPNGSFPYVPGGRGEVNDTVFAILALSPIAEPTAQAAVRDGAGWLLTQQNDDGGWSWEVKGSPSEVDLTGAAIEALSVAAEPGDEATAQAFGQAEEDAFDYLHGAQRSDGGFAEFPRTEGESNVASTAWAVQGIWSAGGNPETWLTGSGEASEEPLDYMESMQQADGHIRWRQSSDMNGIWMTAYVAPAFAGQALPIPAVPRAATSGSVATNDDEAPANCGESGPGGESPQPPTKPPQPGGGVIAGGGGEGAPLFSRPKPQSKGRTPGGARLVRNKGARPTDHSDGNRRGANTRQPSGTETAEPAGHEPVGSESETVTAGASSAGSGRASGGAGRESPAPETGTDGPPLPGPLAAKAGGGGDGHEVSGVVVGGSAAASRPGPLAFGAPGLRSGGTGAGNSQWVAAGIAAAALLLALLGAQLERRRGEVLA
ncbi:MAG TPA: prenyltransferase/squalene oxidase repeat-containing protein [Solirubrobacterales bacterium]|nr:prenyltransferase/squalene oxidase repeat-containing protein [Solirubrobacterales bacterium]